jgi:tungstate transport system permease protein
LRTSLSLIGSLDREVIAAASTSVSVALWSIGVAALIGVPIGIAIGVTEFPLKRLIITLLNTLMALPTVVVGLLVYGIISRQGPMGELGLLFTPQAIIIGQSILAIPIVANYTLGSIRGADSRIMPTALTLGAGRLQSVIQLAREVRFGIMAALIAGFGRVIAEVGVAMMLGGNIRGYTRTMTTAIALETSKGEFAFGLALGLILMAVALVVNLFLNVLQQR